MTTPRFDLVVIGAGIVGLATAMEAARRAPGARLLVVEKEDRVGTHQTGHNSGVVHSGLYYRPGSLKARLAVEGAAALLAFCRERGLPHAVCGKVVVATAERELPGLEELMRRGAANGVPGLALIGPELLREIEPCCRGLRALHVPGTAVTDFQAVSRAFAEIVTASGGVIRTGAAVIGIRGAGTGRGAAGGGGGGDRDTVVETTSGAFAARLIVNCAGLHSDTVARMAGADIDCAIVPFRGEYFEVVPGRRHLVRALIYPVPDPRFPFLGIHLTRTVHGLVEAGPNAVLAWKREGYRRGDVSLAEAARMLLDPGFWGMAARFWRTGLAEARRSLSRAAFARSVQRFLPDLVPADLVRGGTGVRAQAVDRGGRLLADFRIVRAAGMVHVLNVPSPAATASIVIGRHIIDLLADALPGAAAAGRG